ncbi:ACP synthase, partial [Burkholderia multivorans]
MAKKKPDEGPLNLTPDMLHTAARLEDRFNRWIQNRATDQNYQRTVLAYDTYGGTDWVRVLARLVLTPDGHPSADAQASVRGWRSFVSVPLPNDTAWVRINDEEHMVTSDRGGIIDTVIPGHFTPGETEIELWTDGSLVDSAAVRIIGEDSTFGIISDIDDTVMVTSLPRPFLAAWNTFVLSEHARSPVAGMSVLYDRITYMRPNTPILYLSTGAWNSATTLKRFLSRNLYPIGPLLLTD